MRIVRNGPGPTPPVLVGCYQCKSLLEVTNDDAVRTVFSKGRTSHVIPCGVCEVELWIDVERFRS